MKKEHACCLRKELLDVMKLSEVMSLMKTRKSIGPRMEPWATPDPTGRGVEM